MFYNSRQNSSIDQSKTICNVPYMVDYSKERGLKVLICIHANSCTRSRSLACILLSEKAFIINKIFATCILDPNR